MDRQDFVQQYVERQKAYLSTYSTEHLLNERHGTPSKPARSDEFGFDTPVLRPRVLGKAIQLLQAGASKSRTAEPNQSPGRPPTPPVAPSEAQDKPRSKRKKASTSIDSDNERAARLADRRERKRKKRAIVNPPKHNDDIVPAAGPKKGANGQKAKKPNPLALLYGFSATNVTKDRLTLKPSPCLGVFNKGKASAKKKVTATGKSSSRNEFFSESAFLNKPSEQVADHSRINDVSDGSSVSLISNQPMPRVIRNTNRTKKDRGKCTETPTVKTPKASTHTAAESEIWDIEVQSRLPSFARDVSSDPEAEDSDPVVLDIRRAEWGASFNMTEERHTKAGTPILSATRSRSRERSVVCGSPTAISDTHDKVPHAVDAPSIHPSHSASQIGRRVVDTQPSDLRLVTSKYFTEPKPATVQELAAPAPQTSGSNDIIDILDSQIPGQDVEDATLDVHMTQRAVPSISSPTSVPQPLVEFQTRYDVAPLEFPSDGSPWGDCYTRLDVPVEPPRGPDRGYFESSVVESTSAAEYHQPHQSSTWDYYLTDDVEDAPVEAFQGPYDPLDEDDLGERESAVEPCFFETRAEYDLGEGHFSGEWFCMADTGQDFPAYDGSIRGSEESLHCGEPGEDVPGFLEGRALLLGVAEDHKERPGCARLLGLMQAEMDVASRLRDHWRPLRL